MGGMQQGAALKLAPNSSKGNNSDFFTVFSLTCPAPDVHLVDTDL